MKLAKGIVLLISLVWASMASADLTAYKEAIKTNPGIAAGLFRPYPTEHPVLTPTPQGYSPFYISHYGRHGSRWLGAEKDYDLIVKPFEEAASAGRLTPKGKEVYERVKVAVADGRLRAGALSPLGHAQHRGIAERMYLNFPGVFTPGGDVDARSTIIVRCVVSMNEFLERLKELNPTLKITRESTLRSTRPLEYFYPAANYDRIDPGYTKFITDEPYLKEVGDMFYKKGKIDKLSSSLFGKNAFKNKREELDWFFQFFYLVSDMPNVKPEISFWDLFDSDQLYWISVAENYRCYVKRGPHPQSAKWTMEFAKHLLQDIVERADSAISGNGRNADLRFGHDLNIMPMAPLMCLNSTDKMQRDPEKIMEQWGLYELTPMAANLQLVFYRPQQSRGDILVKILLNENEAKLPISSVSGPYYRWDDVKNLWKARMNEKF